MWAMMSELQLVSLSELLLVPVWTLTSELQSEELLSELLYGLLSVPCSALLPELLWALMCSRVANCGLMVLNWTAQKTAKDVGTTDIKKPTVTD
jgi:hypothetical protein